MKIIDEDGSGEIDRLEWMMYLVTPDPDSGLAVFDLNLRELFNRYDRNKDGAINVQELVQLLIEDQSNLTVRLDTESKENLNQNYMLELAESCMTILKNKNNIAPDERVEWSEFKFFRVKCKKRIEESVAFIDNYVQGYVA
jgi:Ca2+-binding EF-hand superfamily protein